MLYQTAFSSAASFPLLHRNDEDLYHVIKSNIIGGPSIIFTRYHENGKTYIRSDKSTPCESILGYDANSLYVHALSQQVETISGELSENEFKPTKSNHRFTTMYDWMEWLNHSENLCIHHKMNMGREKLIGPYLVDGYEINSNTVYEFLGCFFHGHSCMTVKDSKQRDIKLKKTMERLNYIRNQGHRVVSIWECEFS